MKGNRDRAGRVIRMREDVVATGYPIDDKSRSPPRRKDLPRGCDGQPLGHAATVTFRTLGEASAGMGRP